jgi:outer membrane translocation and assembly module TamA
MSESQGEETSGKKESSGSTSSNTHSEGIKGYNSPKGTLNIHQLLTKHKLNTLYNPDEDFCSPLSMAETETEGEKCFESMVNKMIKKIKMHNQVQKQINTDQQLIISKKAKLIENLNKKFHSPSHHPWTSDEDHQGKYGGNGEAKNAWEKDVDKISKYFANKVLS